MSANITRKTFLSAASLAALGLAACNSSSVNDGNGSSGSAVESTAAPVTSGDAPLGENPSDMAAVTIDMSNWSYDTADDVWYQIGVQYCATPAATDYESMGIYVPGPYFSGTSNDDGTYSCIRNGSGIVGSYTGETAPYVMPINTAGYSAQAAPTSYDYSSISEYLEAGLIYVYAGCRGRDNGTDEEGNVTYAGGAPWGVTDLKAAVRCLRYNASSLPGDPGQVFTFGHSGGGAQSALMGATGDSALYAPYLTEIGAIFADDNGNAISDAVSGAQCWCPITSLDMADAAYEWNMGQFANTGTRAEGTFTKQLSTDLAASFASYINGLGLEDEDGNALALEEGGEGTMTSGSYYDYVLQVVEDSLNNFLDDTEFPYTPSSTTMADGGFGGAGGAPSGEAPSGDLPSGEAPSGDVPSDSSDAVAGAGMGDLPTDSQDATAGAGGAEVSADSSDTTAGAGGSEESVTYETVTDYIASLNSDEEWISYDESSNTATITGLGAFVRHCKSASKDVCAFDALDLSQAENKVFGDTEQDARHFDMNLCNLLIQNADLYLQLSDWNDGYPDAYINDIGSVDDLGVEQTTRQNMYNPMYYVCEAYDGFGASTVADHWRIRTGIEQGDTANTVEINLALALAAGGQDVDFETVWGQGHTTAERTGSSTTNFIEWVESCSK